MHIQVIAGWFTINTCGSLAGWFGIQTLDCVHQMEQLWSPHEGIQCLFGTERFRFLLISTQRKEAPERMQVLLMYQTIDTTQEWVVESEIRYCSFNVNFALCILSVCFVTLNGESRVSEGLSTARWGGSFNSSFSPLKNMVNPFSKSASRISCSSPNCGMPTERL